MLLNNLKKQKIHAGSDKKKEEVPDPKVFLRYWMM